MNPEIQIALVDTQDLPAIIQIARESWLQTYATIISIEQIHFMLNLFYNPTYLQNQLENREHYFIKAVVENNIVGYAHTFLEKDTTYKLSKLYLTPAAQGLGIGKKLLEVSQKTIIEKGASALILNVNRHNPAKDFYIKNGFSIIESVDIPLDKYWLNDYIMHKNLC